MRASHDNKKTPGASDVLTRAAQQFTQRIKSLDAVRTIAFTKDSDGVTIWAVIEAPAFSEKERQPVLLAQVATLQSIKQPGLDFRLININELQEHTDMIIPPHAQMLFRR